MEELAVKEFVPIHWKDIFEIISTAFKDHGKCSVAFLMRKFKISREHSQEILARYEEDAFFKEVQTVIEKRIAREIEDDSPIVHIMFPFKNQLLQLWLENQKERLQNSCFDLKKRNEIINAHAKYFHSLRNIQDSWIQEMNRLCVPIADKIQKDYLQRCYSSPSYRISQHQSRVRRQKIVNNLKIPQYEKFLMEKFYSECPKGHEIDHIVPVCKGGEHRLYNLQWLPKKINREKGAKMFIPLTIYPHCRLDL